MKNENTPCIDIIICVHNALDDVKNCLRSVIETDYYDGNINIIIVDDGSDEITELFLRKFAEKQPNAKIIRREKASGYTVAANVGLNNSYSEYLVMLNSDTVVPKMWISKMLNVFCDRPEAGMVGPMSNAATWQSVPSVTDDKGRFAINQLPQECSVEKMDEIAEICWKDNPVYPRVPLLNGFCMMMKRDVVNKIGAFDEINFPRGYGEEDDYCFRAGDAGFGIFLALNTYVYHAKSKSYGTDRRNLLAKKSGNAFRKKYPPHRIKNSVLSMKDSPVISEYRKKFLENCKAINLGYLSK